MTTRPFRRLATAAVLASTSALVVAPAAARPLSPTLPIPCPAAFPVADVHPGMVATGFTTDRGTTPSPFTATVLGVMPDGVVPGIDMIVVRTSSPAIRRVGGIWEGISGSPVYAADGRLLGAVAFGLSFGTTRTAGITPAAAMYDVRDLRLPSHVALTPSLRRAVVTSGAASAPAAASGLRLLTTPVFVSGLDRTALQSLQHRVQETSPVPIRLHQGGAAPGRLANTDRVQPGSPIAAAMSYGAMTFAFVGTVTAVCDGRALSFGHPMQELGTTTASAHVARVLYVQREPEGASYVMARIGGRVGTVDQDRLPGIRIAVGKTAPTTSIVMHVHATTGIGRVVRTRSAVVDWTPAAATNTAYMGIFSTLMKETAGQARVHWTATGHRRDGSRWTFTRTDRAATAWGIPNDAAELIDVPLTAIVSNTFEDVTVDRVRARIEMNDEFSNLAVTGVSVLQDGHYRAVSPDAVVSVLPGDTLSLRVRLVPYRHRSPARLVDLSLVVPRRAGVGPGTVTVSGGSMFGPPDTSTAMSLDDLLTTLSRAPHAASVVAQLDAPDAMGMPLTHRSTGHAGQVVTGSVTFQVDVGEVPVP